MTATINGTLREVTSTTATVNGTWYYITGTYDGTTLKIYTNGNLEASATYAGTINDYASNGYIARWINTTVNLDGKLDEVRQSNVVIFGQRLDRRIVPSMKVHADFRRTASEAISCEFAIDRALDHLPIGQPSGLHSEPLAELLKARQKRRVASRDRVRGGPEIVALGVDRDEERRSLLSSHCW